MVHFMPENWQNIGSVVKKLHLLRLGSLNGVYHWIRGFSCASLWIYTICVNLFLLYKDEQMPQLSMLWHLFSE